MKILNSSVIFQNAPKIPRKNKQAFYSFLLQTTE